ncbi:expressed unknown protein [Seminavis robusta]|uniref:Uncharacterized protein n=1 Tax=Seminavis robusta TaxID=568900 RepID=A0A9N8EY04_9STRA|nr:expressed unknown protein [Seminavis robusta]|eukprot:Sro1895_g303990.1 n/a (101) ;mRNA; f:11527-11829
MLCQNDAFQTVLRAVDRTDDAMNNSDRDMNPKNEDADHGVEEAAETHVNMDHGTGEEQNDDHDDNVVVEEDAVGDHDEPALYRDEEDDSDVDHALQGPPW